MDSSMKIVRIRLINKKKKKKMTKGKKKRLYKKRVFLSRTSVSTPSRANSKISSKKQRLAKYLQPKSSEKTMDYLAVMVLFHSNLRLFARLQSRNFKT